jgi:hypothetical protein
MSRLHLGLAIAGAVAISTVTVALVATLPPRALSPAGGAWVPSLPGAQPRGALHVHTVRSDGSGTLDEVAQAAARAGLDFVIVSDHGDGTRAPEPPRYRAGVLFIDGVEISSSRGHLVAVALPQAPYPLAGEPRDIVEDVHRLGGVAFAAHVDSPKADLAWRDWSVPVDGFEWLNADSEWRDEPRLRLAGLLVSYLFRGPESLAALFEWPRDTLARWDRFSARGRTIPAVPAADAHARVGWGGRGDEETEDAGRGLPLPSYTHSLQAMSTVIELDTPLSGRAADDAVRIVDALRGGRAYSMVDAYARGGALEFAGETAHGSVRMGDRLPAGQLTRLTARVRAPASATLRLLRNGALIAETSGLTLVAAGDRLGDTPRESAAYRIEVIFDDPRRAGVPWLVSNPIWVIREGGDTPVVDREPIAAGADTARQVPIPLDDIAGGRRWTVEQDARSIGALHAGTDGAHPDPALRLDFTLGRDRSTWVAGALELTEGEREVLRESHAIAISARASQPMRFSVQLRAPSSTSDLRWIRSVFAGGQPRRVELSLDDFRPVRGAPADGHRHASSVLIVIDRVNTAAGTQGTLWIDSLSLVGSRRRSGQATGSR